MTTITPPEAQQQIDRAFVMTTLAEVHTTWGQVAWDAGNYRTAVRHWQTAARYSAAATQDGR